MTSCAEPEAVSRSVSVCDSELGDTLTAERYDAAATRGNGIIYRYIRAHKPPREQSAWIMYWFAEGSRDCNTLMSLHERLSREWSSRGSQPGFHPVLRSCNAHHLRRGSVEQWPFVCPHTAGLMGNSTSCCVSSSPKLRRNAHSRLEPYRPEPELSREDTGCNLQHISDRENIDGGCDSLIIDLCSLLSSDSGITAHWRENSSWGICIQKVRCFFDSLPL